MAIWFMYVMNVDVRIVMTKNRNYIPLTKERAAKVESIFEHPTDSGNCYSVYLKGVDECFWCDTVSEIYRVIDKH